MSRFSYALILFVSLFSFFAGAGLAQEDIRVEARLDSRIVAIDDIVTFRILINANKQIQNYTADFPNLKDFDSFGETNTRNYSNFNGRINATYGIVYSLGAKRKGNLSIPAITVTVDGKKYRTRPVTLKVIESTLGDDIIIRFLPDKNTAFTGEQIELRTELLFSNNVRVTNYDFAEQPQIEGFITIDDTSLGRQPPVNRVEVDGKMFYAALLRKQVLFPLSPGKKSIKPLSVRVQYRRVGVSSAMKMSTIQSRVTEINVKPLPPDAPAGFKGAVGKYELTWTIDREEGKANEPFTLKAELRGVGDIERAPDIQLDLPDDIEIINATSNSQGKLIQGYWAGTKNWEYIIIPKQKGTKTLPAVTYHYFDFDKKQYLSTSTEEIVLEIAKGETPAVTVVPTMPQADAVEGDIRFIKTNPGLTSRDFSFMASWWFWALLAAVPVINVIIFVGKALINLKPGDTQGIKKRKAITNALRELENTRRIPEEKRDFALPKIKGAVIGYFQNKLELPENAISFSEIRNNLVRFDLHESPEIDRLNRIIDMCQADRFAPLQDKKLSIEVMVKSVIVDLQEIDKKL
jgi:hypothetical protein